MKNIKYLLLSAILVVFTACSDDEYDYTPDAKPLPDLTAGSADFSKYVSVGASFSAGFTDNALFKTAQTNSFPNILAEQFANVGGGAFLQPLMNDNIGGFLVNGTVASAPRLFFNPKTSKPELLSATPTTEITTHLSGPFNNYGIPGAKSFHLGIAGYGALNPYFGRMASSATATVIGDAVAQSPTFFTLSEIGGNDVLAYATSGGTGVYQVGNMNAASYGSNDITDPTVFAISFEAAVTALTSNGAKGVVTNVPYITSLAHFTTVPYNPLTLTALGGEATVTALNTQLYGPLKNIFTAYGEPDRMKLLSTTSTNPLLIFDENTTDRSAEITGALTPVLGAPTAAAFGAVFGKARQATAADLFVLPLSTSIGTTVAGVPAPINVNGVTYPLADKWVLTPEEQLDIKTATDLYNQTIETVANQYDLAIVDFKSILQTAASTTGYTDGKFTFTTNLVTGGLISLDGVHLTSRGYAVMANAFLKAIDAKYGSNFIAAGVKANAGDYPTNYSEKFR